MLTVKNFGPENRDKTIGNSLFRISADEPGGKNAPHNWYVAEIYNNRQTGEFAQGRTRTTTSLKEAIDWFNEIDTEREIIDAESRDRWMPKVEREVAV